MSGGGGEVCVCVRGWEWSGEWVFSFFFAYVGCVASARGRGRMCVCVLQNPDLFVVKSIPYYLKMRFLILQNTEWILKTKDAFCGEVLCI